MLFQVAVCTTWQTQISRVLAAKDEGTAKRMYRRSAFYFVGRFVLPGLWGVAAFVHFNYGKKSAAGNG
jgi:SSS family solute:Na+ symporter